MKFCVFFMSLEEGLEKCFMELCVFYMRWDMCRLEFIDWESYSEELAYFTAAELTNLLSVW